MKTGESNLDNKKNQIPIRIRLLPLISMLTAILASVINHIQGTELVKTGTITLLLTAITVFYIRINAEQILPKKRSMTIITLGYLISILLLLLVPNPQIFSFWMIGGLLVAMLIDYKLGLLLHFNLSILMVFAITMNLESMLQVLIVGGMMCILAGALKQKSTVIYAMIILLSTNITVAFVINNFLFDNTMNYNYIKSLVSIFLVIAIAFIFSMVYGRSDASFGIKESEILSNDITVSAAQVTSNQLDKDRIDDNQEEKLLDEQLVHEARTSYEVLCDFDNELLQRLKQYSESLYAHALRIGDLSDRAAKEIGANDMLALAGGLYHEIGKINGKDYIEEGLILAEKYSFPKELKAILKEHNIKYEKPSSVEAAIVMLSDNIAATIEYIEKNDAHKFTTSKIIENVFQMRMEKGTLDSSSLSLKDYKKLKEFYQKEFEQQ